MPISPPTVGAVYSQTEVNDALAAICAFIDTDRARLDTTEAADAATAAAAAAAATALANLRQRLRIRGHL
jgi:hypothetical protein